MRIVSLLPSATEILFDLGLGDDVVGVTFECDFPPQAKSRRIVSTSALPENLTPAEIDTIVKQRMQAGEDLYKLDRGAFADLDPDLVVTQDLCAVCAVDVSVVDDALAFLACTADVLTLDPMTLDAVIESVATTGAATQTQGRADEIVTSLKARVQATQSAVAGRDRPNVFVLEWTDPAFSAGHWVPDLVDAAGGSTLLGNPGENSVGVEWQTVTDSNADIVIVSPCGFRLDGAASLAEEVIAQDVLPPDAQVWAVDADAFMVRPGPRVVDGIEALATIFHPSVAGTPDLQRVRQIR